MEPEEVLAAAVAGLPLPPAVAAGANGLFSRLEGELFLPPNTLLLLLLREEEDDGPTNRRGGFGVDDDEDADPSDAALENEAAPAGDGSGEMENDFALRLLGSVLAVFPGVKGRFSLFHSLSTMGSSVSALILFGVGGPPAGGLPLATGDSAIGSGEEDIALEAGRKEGQGLD